MAETVLRTIGLTKQYAQTRAVDHVDMTVRRGDIYGFIGQNGAGKTTLIRMVTSLINPTEGEIELFSQASPKGLADARKRIGCVVEGPAFFPGLTAEQNLEYYRIQRGFPDKSIVQRVLEQVSLTGTGKKKFKDFSLGMKQRLGLALAVMGEPDFLILDEPINGLDPMGIVEIRTILKRFQEENGTTILVSSHILAELAQVATTYGIIHQGRMVKQFSQAQLEEETKRCISIKVDDTPKAVTVLEDILQTTAYKVVDQNELRIYAYLDNPSEVTFQLSTNGVRVQSAAELGVNLEEYFLNAIGQNQERRA